MAEPGNEPWLLVEPGVLEPGAALVLPETEARHVSGALRCARGDRVVLTDGAGAVARAVLQKVARSTAEVEIADVEHVDPPGGPRLALALSVLHGQAMDWAVQKAVELGVTRLVPTITARSQLSLAVASRRMTHWSRIASQALKQCHRAWAMELSAPARLEPIDETFRSALRVVADPGGSRVARLGPGDKGVLLVGPEGGLTGSELRQLESWGWARLWLAPHILRAETAAVAGAAVLSWHAAHERSTCRPATGSRLRL